MELFSNFATSVLSASITNAQTTLAVTSASSFSLTGSFRVIVESEIMQVTAVSGSTFTIVRGTEGTTAVAHSSGLTVTQIITAAALKAFRGDDIILDTVANRPSAGTAGRIYIPSDGNGSIGYDDGSNWNALGLYGFVLSPTTIGTFGTALGNGTGTFAQNGDSIIYDLQSTGATAQINIQLKTVTPPVTITAQVSAQYLPTGSCVVLTGLIIRDSATGNCRLFGWEQTGTTRQFGVFSLTYSSGTPATPTTVTATSYTNFPDVPRFLRIFQPTSSNRLYQISIDNQNWVTYLSEAFNTGAASVNQSGFVVFQDGTYTNITNNDVTLVIRSYLES